MKRPPPKARWAEATNSLRFKITGSYLLTLALIFAPIGAVAYTYMRGDLIHDADEGLRTTAAMIIVRLVDTLHTVGPADAEQAMTIQLAQLEHFGITSSASEAFLRLANRHTQETLYASKGLKHSVLVSRLSRIVIPPPAMSVVDFEGVPRESRMRVLTTVVPNSDDIIQIAIAWDRNETEIESVALRIATAILGLLVLSAIAAHTLIVRALDPVAQIVGHAERLSADHMPKQLLPPPPTSDTEIRDLVGALNRMMARLQKAADRRHQFTADAAHELRTPLTIMQGEMEVALIKERSAERYRQVIESSLEETKRLSRIVRDLGILARSDSGGGAIENPEPINLAGTCTDVVQSFALIADDREIGLKVDVHSNDVVVIGDEDAITRLLGNLVGNALNYTRPGGTVRVSVARDQARAFIKVSDTGVGIDEGDIPHIFNRFYRADKARVNTGGHGLGLAIVKGIAETHQGTVSVESVVGEGSTFTVMLPLSPMDGRATPR